METNYLFSQQLDAYVINYNSSPTDIGNPICADINYTEPIIQSELGTKRHVMYHVPGLIQYEEDIDIENTTILEQRKKVYNSKLYICHVSPDYKQLIELFAESRAREMHLIFPTACLDRNRVKFANIKVSGGTGGNFPDPLGKACVMLMSLFCGLLRARGCTIDGSGIGRCSPIDTIAEAINNETKWRTIVKSCGDRSPPMELKPKSQLEQEEAAKRVYDDGNMIVGGNFDNPETFSINYKNLGPVNIKRYNVYVETVETGESPNNTVVAYVVRFRILDRRISFLKGIERTISINLTHDAEVRKKKVSGKKSQNSPVYAANDMTFDTSYLNGYSQIISTKEYTDYLRLASGNPDYKPFESDPNASAAKELSTNMDPLNVLSPEEMYKVLDPPAPDGRRVHYQYGVFSKKEDMDWTQEKFEDEFALKWAVTSYPICLAPEDGFTDIDRLMDPNDDPGEVDYLDPDHDHYLLATFVRNDDYRIHVNIFPENVFRLRPGDIGAFTSLHFLLPDMSPVPHFPTPDAEMPTAFVAYPIQGNHIVQACDAVRDTIVQKMKENENKYRKKQYDSDAIALHYFDKLPCKDFSDSLSELFKRRYPNINGCRLTLIFDAAWKTLIDTNGNLPGTLQKCLKYLESQKTVNGQSKLFVDFFNSTFEGSNVDAFEYIEGSTPTDTFWINVVENLLKHEKHVYQNFHAYLPVFLCVSLKNEMLYKYFLQILFQGDSSSGKSLVVQIFSYLFYAGTFKSENNMSKRAIEYTQEHADIVFADDAGPNNHPIMTKDIFILDGTVLKREVLKNLNDISVCTEIYKSLVTNGFSIKTIAANNQTDDKQLQHGSTTIVGIRRSPSLILANPSISDLTEAMMTRAYYMFSKPNNKDMKGMKPARLSNANNRLNTKQRKQASSSSSSSSSTNKKKRNRSDDEESDDDMELPRTEKFSVENVNRMLEEIELAEGENLPKQAPDGRNIITWEKVFKSFQGFCDITNHLMACGAIPYGKEQKTLFSTYVHRLREMIKLLYPGDYAIKTWTSRLDEDIIAEFVKAFMLLRVWCNICSGVYDHEALKPNANFSMETFLVLHATGQFVPTEEDVLKAFSLFGHIIPPIRFVAVIDWILDIMENKCELGIRNKTIKCKYTKFRPRVQDTHRHNPGSGMAPTFTAAPGDQPSSSSSDSGSSSQTQNFGNAHRVPDASRHSPEDYNPNYIDMVFKNDVLVKIGTIINSLKAYCRVHYPYLDDLMLKRGLFELAEYSVQCNQMEFHKVGTDYTLRKAQYTMETFQPITFTPSQSDEKLYTLSVSTAWLAHIVHPEGCIAKKVSHLSPDHKSTPMETFLRNFSFTNCKKYRMLMPGMFYDAPVDPAKSGPDMRSYMMALDYGEGYKQTSMSTLLGSSTDEAVLTETYLVPQLEIPNTNDAYAEASKQYYKLKPQGDSYNTAIYIDTLISSYEKGYYNIYSKTIVDKSDDLKVEPGSLISTVIFSVATEYNPERIIDKFHQRFKQKGRKYPEDFMKSQKKSFEQPKVENVEFISLSKLRDMSNDDINRSLKKSKHSDNRGQSRYMKIDNIQQAQARKPASPVLSGEGESSSEEEEEFDEEITNVVVFGNEQDPETRLYLDEVKKRAKKYKKALRKEREEEEAGEGSDKDDDFAFGVRVVEEEEEEEEEKKKKPKKKKTIEKKHIEEDEAEMDSVGISDASNDALNITSKKKTQIQEESSEEDESINSNP